MKIRNGFVSNSSTSSFCIFGCKVTEDELIEVVKKHFDLSKYNADYELDKYEAADVFCKNVQGVNYNIIPEGDDDIYFGRELSTMDEDETPRQFKANIRGTLSEYFPEAVFDTYDETYYN